MHSFNEEAIPERDPSFELTGDTVDARTARAAAPLTWWEETVWRAMVARRPNLAGLMGE